MDLEIFILSEVSQTEKDKYHITSMWNLKIIQINLFIKQTHRFRECTYGCQGERLGGRESWGVWMLRYTLLHLKWIINKDLLTVQQSVLTVLCSMLCGILEG